MKSSSLADNRLFHRLNEHECALIEHAGQWVQARKGQAIIAEREVNRALYLVMEGSVDVRISDSMGTSMDLATHGPGMMIGEYSFIDGLPAAASAVATSDSVLFMINHERLNAMLEKYDRIGRIVYRNLLAVLVERLRASNAELDLFCA